MEIRVLEPGEHLDDLAEVLLDCVDGGASVGYMAPFMREHARAAMAGFADGRRVVLGAFHDGELVGTAQLVPSPMPNQPHRADVAKVLVKRSARGRGIAAQLMERIEREARGRGITVLVLDTVTGSAAYRLYERLGWQRVGPVPNYALMPDGAPCETTFFYKELT
ncbi:MAG TPA: GNAT family N-acetyltransferase [Gaiellaceae bacterium]|nr:GNAT family N-acetyltransferase [Gaiellaceae bacterium]